MNKLTRPTPRATRGPVLARSLAALAVTALLAACGGKSEKDLLDAAQASLAQKDSKTAVIQLKNALAANPQSPEARLLLGKTLLELGDAPGALLELRKAQELQVSDERVLPELARAMIQVGEETRLLAQYNTTQLKDPTAAADLKTSLATAQAIQGDNTRAAATIDEALRLKPGFVPATIVLARLRALDGAPDDALALLDQVLIVEPGNDRAGILKADMLLYGKKDIEGAGETLRKVLKAKPDSIAARASGINILFMQQKLDVAKTEFELLKKAAPNHPETLYYEAQFAFNDKDYKRTREVTEQILKAFPNNVRVLELAGAAEFRLRNYLPAEALLAKALKLAPQQGLSRLLLAQTYLRLGEPAKTIDLFKSLLESGKADGATLALAGEAYLQLGDAKRSEQVFAAALKAAPSDPRVRTSAAMAQLARGNAGGAVAELEAVAASDKGSRADLALISAKLRQNDFNGALKAIDGLEKKLPDQALPMQLRGRVLTLKQDIPGAIKAFEAAMTKEPAYFPPVASLAALDLVNKKPEEARKRFNAFLQAQPKSWQARMAIAELEARTGAPAATVTEAMREAVKANASEARPHLGLINNLLSNGDAKGALLAAQNATAALPNNMELLDALGRAELAAGDTQRSLSTFKKLAGLQPKNAMHEMRLAEVYMTSKDTEAAARSLRRALELQPENIPAMRGLAQVAMAERKPQDALKVARQLQTKFPQNPTGFNVEGEIEISRKGWDAAAAAFRSSLKIAKSSEVAAKLHSTLVAGGKTAEADQVAADWVKANPKDTSFHYFLGDVALSRNDLPRAETHYRAVLAVQPENALALNNVAWLLVKQGKPGALGLAEQANKILPDRAPLVDTLSLALEAENRLPDAVAAQKKAITLEPKDPGLQLRLAKLYIKQGDKSRARAELETLDRLGDKFPGRAEVTSLLKTL